LGIWGLGWGRRAGAAGEAVERCLAWRGQGVPMTSSWCASTCGCCCWRHWKGWLERISRPCRRLRGSHWRTCCPSSSTTMSRTSGNRRLLLVRQNPIVKPASVASGMADAPTCTMSEEDESGLVLRRDNAAHTPFFERRRLSLGDAIFPPYLATRGAPDTPL